MDSDKSITANFNRQYTLTIAAGTGGTTNPAPGIHTYDEGTDVPITAVPNSGYEFDGWSGDASGTDNPITITMDSDKSITANFRVTAEEEEPPDEGGPCFIATAAYSSSQHPHVNILRDFRDRYLMPSTLGRKLVSLYYKYSPLAANLIAGNKVLRTMVRISLLPFVVFSYSMVHLSTATTAAILLFIFALPVFLVRFYPRKRRDDRK
jgi:uncharacterized repeat protein (TIGR02543 family)